MQRLYFTSSDVPGSPPIAPDFGGTGKSGPSTWITLGFDEMGAADRKRAVWSEHSGSAYEQIVRPITLSDLVFALGSPFINPLTDSHTILCRQYVSDPVRRDWTVGVPSFDQSYDGVLSEVRLSAAVTASVNGNALAFSSGSWRYASGGLTTSITLSYFVDIYVCDKDGVKKESGKAAVPRTANGFFSFRPIGPNMARRCLQETSPSLAYDIGAAVRMDLSQGDRLVYEFGVTVARSMSWNILYPWGGTKTLSVSSCSATLEFGDPNGEADILFGNPSSYTGDDPGVSWSDLVDVAAASSSEDDGARTIRPRHPRRNPSVLQYPTVPVPVPSDESKLNVMLGNSRFNNG